MTKDLEISLDELKEEHAERLPRRELMVCAGVAVIGTGALGGTAVGVGACVPLG
jgi:hypothetical protein